MVSYVTIDEFATLSERFKEQLQTARNFEEIREMWRSTNFPYAYASADPFSPTYRDQVLKLYQKLTRTSYSPQNEMTSTKQSKKTFDIGYPWVSGNLEVAAIELGKTVQALHALHARQPTAANFIEFGAGWGNLAIPLAKTGKDVTVVDIDAAFLDRIERIAKKDNFHIKVVNGDFVEVAKGLPGKYDAVIFQSSFHHCLDFEQLLQAIRSGVLAEHGKIYFFAEPIFRDFTFPWGLRHDGESIWAITCNHWLELGFDFDFFFELLLRNGLLLSYIEPFPPFIGEGWVADQGTDGIAFEDWRLPEHYSSTFHPAARTRGFGRYCQELSILPPLNGSYLNYELQFQNYADRDLNVQIVAGDTRVGFVAPPNRPISVKINAAHRPVSIQSNTYVPHEIFENGDTRLLGVALQRVKLE
jgi:2-polyprenyl-3-methyl-5-hydroxy-6-metoxy-1,4-benzoquinol methylase